MFAFARRTRWRNRSDRWLYAGGRRPEIPGELKKPLAEGEAVRIVPRAPLLVPMEFEEAARREDVMRGCGLK